jgi:septal ring factor EnvC (AmiA/AmiB activator)
LQIRKHIFSSYLPRVLVVSLAVTWMPSSFGQESGLDQETLDLLKTQIAEGESRSVELESEAAEIAEETRDIRNQLVGFAARVQERESAVIEAERALDELTAQEKLLTAQFEERYEALADTLAALQTLQSNPPPALFVHPEDAADAARSAILLSEIAPALKAQADELADKLTRLQTTRDALIAQRQSLLIAEQSLQADRDRLSALLQDREQKHARLANLAATERQRVGQLAAKARGIEELIEGLRKLGQLAIPRRKPAIPSPESNIPLPRPSPFRGLEQGRELRAAPLQTSPGLKVARFSASRGNLRLPANGHLAAKFGQKTVTGAQTKGITIATRPGTQVVAPFDGEIVFAGPYLSYGQLLIIAAGEGYHLILSGMARIDGLVGQRLLAGEPVGQMAEASSSKTKAAEELYFEIRKDGEAFNPTPWLALSERKAVKQ